MLDLHTVFVALSPPPESGRPWKRITFMEQELAVFFVHMMGDVYVKIVIVRVIFVTLPPPPKNRRSYGAKGACRCIAKLKPAY